MATKTKEPITVVPTKNPDRQTDQSISEKIAMAFGKFWNVIVWNDDIHSFDWHSFQQEYREYQDLL